MGNIKNNLLKVYLLYHMQKIIILNLWYITCLLYTSGSLCSTILNKRTDKYGGTLENRTRFALEFVRALKKAVPNMTIDYKFSVVTPERGKGGVNLDEASIFAKWLEEAGVDMLHVCLLYTSRCV